MMREHLVTDNPNYDAVCFHAQQCAEKYMKARLVDADVFLRKTHDLLFQDASKSYALSAQDFSLLPLKSRVKIAEDERKPTRSSYDYSLDGAYCLEYKIPLPRFGRRYKGALSRFARANLRFRRCPNSFGRGQQRPRSYAHRISAEIGSLGFGQTLERSLVAPVASGISKAERAILGQPLLGNRIRCVEQRQYHG